MSAPLNVTADLSAMPIPKEETHSEYLNDVLLGLAFVLVGIAATQRCVIDNQFIRMFELKKFV